MGRSSHKNPYKVPSHRESMQSRRNLDKQQKQAEKSYLSHNALESMIADLASISQYKPGLMLTVISCLMLGASVAQAIQLTNSPSSSSAPKKPSLPMAPACTFNSTAESVTSHHQPLSNLFIYHQLSIPFTHADIVQPQIECDEDNTLTWSYSDSFSNSEKCFKKIKQSYNELMFKIDEAKSIASISKKPLLILLGEVHGTLDSLINESIILHIAKTFQIQNVFTEAFSHQSYLEAMSSECKGCEDSIESIRELEEVIDKLNMLKISIDFGSCGSYVSVDSNECKDSPYVRVPKSMVRSEIGLQERNTIMADQLKNELTDKVAIVGANHLYGLLHETALKDFYHILSISVDPHEQYDKIHASEEACLKQTRTKKEILTCFCQFSKQNVYPTKLPYTCHTEDITPGKLVNWLASISKI